MTAEQSPEANAAATAPSPLSRPSVPHVTVCICTFRRAELLRRLLAALERQRTDGRFTFSVVVSDNDSAGSAREVVRAFGAGSTLSIGYCVEPRQNIALARNRAIAAAQGDYIAFIDDDEFPEPDWLTNMIKTCERFGSSGVLGPVRPHFDTPPPSWVVRGRFCDRPEHPTGTVMRWDESRTGNLLFRRSILEAGAVPFRAEFGTGGEDVDFFRRMTARGCTFVWCNEGVAYEVVPPSRCTRGYMLRRALLRGRIGLKHRGLKASLLGRSLIAVPVYSVALPVSALLGQHVFMKLLIRWCDHVGRLLAMAGINPVRERAS